MSRLITKKDKKYRPIFFIVYKHNKTGKRRGHFTGFLINENL